MKIQFSKIEDYILEKEYVNTETSAIHKKYSLPASITILEENNVTYIKKRRIQQNLQPLFFLVCHF